MHLVTDSPSFRYSMLQETRAVFDSLLLDPGLPLLAEARRSARDCVRLINDFPQPLIPIDLRAGESFAALKALEAGLAVAIAEHRYGPSGGGAQDQFPDKALAATVDVVHASLLPLTFYMSTIDGFYKTNQQEMARRLRDMDHYHVFDNVYRHAVTNMYKTKDGRYFQLHANLDADSTLALLGLPAYDESIKTNEAAISVIAQRTCQFTSQNLDDEVITARILGSPCLTREEFLATPQGKIVRQQPLFAQEMLESSSPPFKPGPGRNVLSNVKILDLTRIIAGPVVVRTLAEYGADVIRVTNLNLPDSSYYQVDFNFGKRTVDLDLKSPSGRIAFESLLQDVDVIVDGYRPGAMERLGYGPANLVERFRGRGKGFVYLSVNCYGWGGPWSDRPGWQQIADAVSGISWAHGKSLGKDEPVGHPFPLADFGNGQAGCIAVLNALHHRLVHGGSYHTTVSLAKFNDWLVSNGTLPKEVWAKVLSDHAIANQVDHYGDFDIVGQVAYDSMKRLYPEIVGEESPYMFGSQAHFGLVKTLAPVVQMNGFKEGWLNTTRWPGWDKASWLGSSNGI